MHQCRARCWGHEQLVNNAQIVLPDHRDAIENGDEEDALGQKARNFRITKAAGEGTPRSA